MRIAWWLLLAGFWLAGCADQPKPVDFPAPPGPSHSTASLPAPPPVAAPVKALVAVKTNAPPRRIPIVTPDLGLSGKVIRVNDQSRVVVVEFPLGKFPGAGKPLNVYRDDLKVGELRATRWQQDQNQAADLVAGEAKVGDTVRDH